MSTTCSCLHLYDRLWVNFRFWNFLFKKNKLFNPSGTKIDIGILLEMISDMWRISDILAVLTGARIKLHK